MADKKIQCMLCDAHIMIDSKACGSFLKNILLTNNWGMFEGDVKDPSHKDGKSRQIFFACKQCTKAVNEAIR